MKPLDYQSTKNTKRIQYNPLQPPSSPALAISGLALYCLTIHDDAAPIPHERCRTPSKFYEYVYRQFRKVDLTVASAMFTLPLTVKKAGRKSSEVTPSCY